MACALIWGVGHFAGMPKKLRVSLIAILYLAAVLALLVLPASSGLNAWIGGTVGTWLFLGGFAVIIWAYSRFVAFTKGRADKAKPQPDDQSFSATQLERYARHIVLREIGGTGQTRLKEAKVLVVGAGGLGSPALVYLAAAGVGTIGVIDDDIVENSNLQRQVIHNDAAIGTPKVFSAQAAMEAQTPSVIVQPYNRRLGDANAASLIAEYDLVLDGSDNFETRYLVNRVCAELGKPLIGAALTQWEGQISLYDPANGTPCYQCIFPQAPDPGLAPSCAEAGVLGPLPGVIGSLMAVEAIKAICGAGEGLRGRMMLFDALFADTRIIALKPRPDCPVCGEAAKDRADN
ncbi:MAG: HesA/MoeB/ThiF family protein [Marinosulfonomonas sp.]|nr:HesA/MoeB/ThiF family protein [Marinosulfonomonas sp.]